MAEYGHGEGRGGRDAPRPPNKPRIQEDKTNIKYYNKNNEKYKNICYNNKKKKKKDSNPRGPGPVGRARPLPGASPDPDRAGGSSCRVCPGRGR